MVDLVDGVCVSGGDEQVSVRVDVDRIDVEVVVQDRWVLRRLGVGLADCDMVDASPVEEHAARAEIDFLDTAFDDAPSAHTSPAKGRH